MKGHKNMEEDHLLMKSNKHMEDHSLMKGNTHME